MSNVGRSTGSNNYGALPTRCCYMLGDDGRLLPVDFLSWGRAMQRGHEDGSWIVGSDKAGEGVDRTEISTVFIGLNYKPLSKEAPLLWETLVMGGVLDGTSQRYRSRAEAVRGHAKMSKPNYLICDRIAELPQPEAPSVERACSRCDRAVWVSRGSLRVLRRVRGKAICCRCAHALGLFSTHKIADLQPEQLPEVLDFLVRAEDRP